MRLVRFNRNVEPPSLARLGVLITPDIVADLRGGYAAFLHRDGGPHAREISVLRMPSAIASFLQLGRVGQQALQAVLFWLAELATDDRDPRGPVDDILFTPLADCRRHAPLRLTKLVIAYDNHLNGTATGPSFTLKPPTSVVDGTHDIRCPGGVGALRCAPGLAIVIGRKCTNASEMEAIDAIAGYTAVNDVRVHEPSNDDDTSAFTSGMFESFAPMGPWLVTKYEIHDPMNLQIEMRVNGDLRHQFKTPQMRWPVSRLVAYLSRMMSEPGDVIWTESVAQAENDSGVRVDDVVETHFENIGDLRNRLVA